ncbi:thiamine pyrophosphokinase, putative [Plasmodium ovale]|uniref:Thiamine pyrophosphokinase, putative n=2 Tax=Plasmodium ovale TaxID=36330 RepID=A0A1D3U7X0_PLAOA|nr:thiamine pyrophosphokinase, putative [Plasmodium ovale]
MKKKCMSRFKCVIIQSPKIFTKMSQRRVSSSTGTADSANSATAASDLSDVNRSHWNCVNKKKEKDSFFHDLNFMRHVLSNNGSEKSETSPSGEGEHRRTDEGKLITIILNNTLCGNSAKIIVKSDIVICADGGANQLYNLCQKLHREKTSNSGVSTLKGGEIRNEKDTQINEHLTHNTYMGMSTKSEHKNDKYSPSERKKYENFLDENKLSHLFNIPVKRDKNASNFPHNILPDLICGDFDSINVHVYNYYKNKSVLFEKCSNQEDTDLDKCIDKIKRYIKNDDKVLILGATGNRFDHTCANISSLYKNVSVSSLYLIGENNFIFLLRKGYHVINTDSHVFEKNCGILPIGGKCKIKTEGLKYDLNYEYLSFDKRISSSNEIIQQCIKVENDSPIVWHSQLKNV